MAFFFIFYLEVAVKIQIYKECNKRSDFQQTVVAVAAVAGKISICTTIRIGQDFLCLPYVGFVLINLLSRNFKTESAQWANAVKKK